MASDREWIGELLKSALRHGVKNEHLEDVIHRGFDRQELGLYTTADDHMQRLQLEVPSFFKSAETPPPPSITRVRNPGVLALSPEQARNPALYRRAKDEAQRTGQRLEVVADGAA